MTDQIITMDGEWQTRDGRPVRVLCVDGPGIYPVIGIVGVCPERWTSTGRYGVGKASFNPIIDLIPAPPKPRTREVWVYWRSKTEDFVVYDRPLHSDDDLARVRITLTEGQFDDLA